MEETAVMSESEFYGAVKECLEGHREDIAKLKTLITATEEELQSGKYSDAGSAEVANRLQNLRQQMSDKLATAEQTALDILDNYQQQAQAANTLNPALLSDDVRLLNCGVTLSRADINAIFARNLDNPTMTQILIRYAEERGLEHPEGYTDTAFYRNSRVAVKAKEHEGNIKTFVKWLVNDNYHDLISRVI